MSQANKGKPFEDLIEYANSEYERHGVALIQKIATPVKVIRAYDPKIQKSKIVSAFHDKKSTVDFLGVIRGGKSVAFDAKSTVNLSGFTLGMIEAHQYEYLKVHSTLGGHSFLLVEFVMTKQVFRLEIDMLDNFMATSERKSIPISYFTKNCHLCEAAGSNPLDFLKQL